MVVGIGCDHGGIVLKPAVIEALQELGIQYVDYGTDSTDSVDYPVYAAKVAEAVVSGRVDKGILMCGTGIGISIAANKVHGIRCAVISNDFCAKMCAEHNNANIIALGGRVSTPEEAKRYVKIYLTTPFAGGRHQKRIDMITAMEIDDGRR